MNLVRSFVLIVVSAFCVAPTTGFAQDAAPKRKVPAPKARPATARGVKPFEVKVLVLNFDPIVDPATQTRLTTAARWNNSRVLVAGYAEDVAAASNGLVRFRLVDWLELDEFPVKKDGFAYTAEEYMRCRQAGKGWHDPDGTDYPKLIARHRIVERVEAGEVDEVWWFGGPYFGFFESAMAGRGAFYINGGTFGSDLVPCSRAFAIMGFNYERGVAEMLHNLSHRTESTMSRIFGGWEAGTLDTDWARFAAIAKDAPGSAGVGNCHFPPNGEKDYDYGNKTFVESTANDWLKYPNLTGAKARLNCEAWGGPDYHRNYMKWWFARLPRAPGVNPKNSRLNNWWEYVFHFNDYSERGGPPRPVDPTAERRAAEWIVSTGGTATVEWAKGRRDVRTPADLPADPFAVVAVALANRPLHDGDLSHLAGLTQITRLDLGHVPLTDAALPHLKDLESLTWLSLTGSRVTGKGLRNLKGLTRLGYLELVNVPLADADLAQLPDFPELRELHLSGTQVTDAGLKHLQNRLSLHKLGLGQTAVTDAGLPSLVRLKGLQTLFIGGSHITDEGVKKLQQTAPRLQAVGKARSL